MCMHGHFKNILKIGTLIEKCYFFTVIDYVGGKLAYFFGITSPDWQYAVDMHEDMKREVLQPIM